MTHIERLKSQHPDLVEQYSAYSKERLLEQICAEVLDLLAMEERVQLFMNECTNLSKTNYTIEVLKAQIADKQEQDISDFCEDLLTDYDAVTEKD